MADTFNPYVEWLGLPESGGDRDHYELLGLERFESDDARITAAADRALARVRKFRPGAHARAWQQLLDELSTAKKVLLDPASKRNYDQRLRDPHSKPSPVPPAASVEPAPAPSASDMILPPTRKPAAAKPQPAAPTKREPVASPTKREAVASPTKREAVATTAARLPPSAAAVAADDPMAPVDIPAEWLDDAASVRQPAPLKLPLAYPQGRPIQEALADKPPVAPGVPAAATSTDDATAPARGQDFDDASDFDGDLAARARRAHQTRTRESDPPAAESKPVVGPSQKLIAASVLIALGLLAAAIGVYIVDEFVGQPEPQVAQTPAAPPANKGGAPETGTGQLPAPTSNDQKTPEAPMTPAPSMQPPAVQAPTTPAPTVQLPAAPAPAVQTPATQTPATDPAMSPRPTAPVQGGGTTVARPIAPDLPAAPPADAAQRQIAFDQTLSEAHAALAARKLDRAKQLIDRSKTFANSDKDRSRAKAMESLHGLVENFWLAVREGMKSVEVASEIQVGSTMVSVVEVGRDSLSIRVEGTKRDYKLSDMPAGLANAIALRWFDETAPTTKMAQGAFQAVDPSGDLAAAQQLWEEASLAGAAIDEVLPSLQEGKHAPDTRRDAIPKDDALAAAAQKVNKTFGQEVAAARKAPTKVQLLAKKLIDVAEKTTEPAERFALLRKAGELASSSGNIDLMLRVVDEMAKSFELEPLGAKADALSKASEVATPAMSKSIVRSSLKLLDQALAARQVSIAQQLNRIAVAAAAKSGDALLIKQAGKRSEQIEKLQGS